jgi:hypothetical protein
MTEQPKEYLDKRQGFVIKSGTTDRAGKITDLSIITDNGQGFQYRTDGVKLDNCNAQSMEVCGENVADGQPAKIIRAKRGNIQIEAIDGDIILIANNIRIQAKDGNGEVTINSVKQIAFNSPLVNTKAGNLNTIASNSASVAAQAVDTVGNLQNSQAAATDIVQGSFLSKLMGILTKFKAFLT